VSRFLELLLRLLARRDHVVVAEFAPGGTSTRARNMASKKLA
jgi:hypothetical protein